MSNIMEGLLYNSRVIQQTIVKGTITEIRKREVIVDIGVKSEGIIPVHEFTDPRKLSVGDVIEVYLERIENKDGNPVISFNKAVHKKNWEKFVKEYKEGTKVSGIIKDKVKGGFLVNIGVDAFLPASQIDVHTPVDIYKYIGNTYVFKILKINKKSHNIIISRRTLIEEQRLQIRHKLMKEIRNRMMYRGRVKNITDYGAFIELSCLDGLLHITDISWSRINHPSSKMKIGDFLNVKIRLVDSEQERVSLSLKDTYNYPWYNLKKKYAINTHVIGSVVKIVSYGTFLQLELGVEGLIHIKELSRTKKPRKLEVYLYVGDHVRSVILAIAKEEKKIALAIRKLDTKPLDIIISDYLVGTLVRSSVRNITNYGAFVELEKGIYGFIHISDISWSRNIVLLSEILKKGDEVLAIVLEVDNNIYLGVKQLTMDPWYNIDKSYKIGDIVTVKVKILASYGAFAELESGVYGLVHISNISVQHINTPKDVLSVGEKKQARIIKIDKSERRIGLSIKTANYSIDQLSAEIANYNNDITSLESILDEATKK